MRFHQALAGRAGSPRVDETVRHLLAELRLVFHVMSAPREFHEPYLRENRRIYHLLASGDVPAAAAALGACLDTAEKQLTSAYAGRGPASAAATSTGATGTPR
jgi:DNA-binding GntR family transcriptional regulator